VLPQPLQDRRAPAQQKSIIQNFPPPVGGWNTRDALPNMGPLDAVVAQNVLIQPSQVVTRLGNAPWATGFGAPVNTLMPYNGAQPGTQKLFAASGTGIYDVTGGGAIGAAVVSGLTNSWWNWVDFGNSAGQFLLAVNGADSMQSYNGTTWTATATLPITGGTTLNLNTVINLCIYNNTLYMVPSAVLGFYYQPAQQFLGTVTFQNISAWCPRGGYLMAMASWTVDGGQGPQDYLVAVTSEGEVVVWQGLAFSIPIGTAGAMNFVGSYYIGRPLGRRCFMKFGGDLLLLSERGLFPMSTGLQSATINRSVALTDKIEPTYVLLAQSTFITQGWQLEACLNQQFLIINVPSSPQQQLVMQLQSKGWANWTGWNCNVLLYFKGTLYYGDAQNVCVCYSGPTDDGNAIVASFLPAFTQLKIPGQQKHVKLVRPYFQSNGNFAFGLSAAVDYAIPYAPPPPSSVTTTLSLWDSALWNTAVWGGLQVQSAPWATVGNWPCRSFSPYFQITTNSAQVGLQAYDILFTAGGVL
jgi:hypothetical protein